MSAHVVFGVGRRTFDNYLRARPRGRVQKIVVSKRPADRFSFSPDAEAVAVYQDLPADSPRLRILTERIIYPAWFRRIPIDFFSAPEMSEYLSKRVRSDALHVDCEAVEAQLVREQLIALLAEQNTYPPRGPETGRSVAPRKGEESGMPPVRPVLMGLDPDLDASQQEAVAHTEGPIRVLAPAGSGKTKTLVNRICNLVNNGVLPEQILPLAFNKKAEMEMNGRLRARSLQRVRARTFHSLGYAIVRSATTYRFSLDGQLAQFTSILTAALQEVYGLTRESARDPLEQCARMIGEAKMDLLPVQDMMVDLGGKHVPFSPLFLRFLALQEERRFMNFDDMIYLALRVLVDNDALRRRCQGRWTFVLVDEFQDLNRAQVLLQYILSLPRNNIFVVGDDDQMIYGWRGANVRHIMEFPRRYSPARACTLSTNYRSARRVVQHSLWLIDHNRQRVRKAIAASGTAPAGEFDVQLHGGIWSQAQAAADWIARAKSVTGSPWREFAVLYRTNALQFPIALGMDRRGIPHTASDFTQLFETPPGRDVTAYLSVILGPENSNADEVKRVLTRPRRLLRRDQIDSISSLRDLENLAASGALPPEQTSSLVDLLEKLSRLRMRASELKPNSLELIHLIDEAFHLRDSYDLRVVVERDADEADDKTYFEVLLSLAEAISAPGDLLARCRFVSGAAPQSARPPQTGIDEVNLSTIHKTKGSEFENVVYFDLSAGRRMDPEEIEEERRVAYVAITRARRRILITSRARKQSPFLREAVLNPEFTTRDREDLTCERKNLEKRLARLQRKIDRLSRFYHESDSTFTGGVSAFWVRWCRRRASRARARTESLQEARIRVSEKIVDLQQELAFRRALSPALFAPPPLGSDSGSDLPPFAWETG